MQHKYTIKNISKHGTCASKAHSLKKSQLTNIAKKNISFIRTTTQQGAESNLKIRRDFDFVD